MPLPTRKIGQTEVSAIGYGAMGLSVAYGPPLPDEERLKILDVVYESGCTFWDSSDIYGDNELLLNKWFKTSGKRNDIFLATKFGCGTGDKPAYGAPEYVSQAFDKSLQRLGVDHVDLYYAHRIDPEVPIELTVGAMKKLVEAGKVKYLGLSECSAQTLRRAHAVHPIAAVQLEYSPFALDIEDSKLGLLQVARELGVAVVAYSPLGRGILSGKYKGPEDFADGDFRKILPKYTKENFPKVLKLVEGLQRIGAKHGATAGQIALAWLLAQGNDIIPIPGTTKLPNLKENLDSLSIKLSPEEIEEVRQVAAQADAANGERYPPGMTAVLYGDTPPLR